MAGFKEGTFLGGSFNQDNSSAYAPPVNYNHGHIAMTYTALCTLKTLGDDWSRLDKKGIINALKYLQLPTTFEENDGDDNDNDHENIGNGSFQCIAVGSEHDMRFLYCATSISYMLNDWSGIDIDRACDYIQACRSPIDGALSLIPGQEGHGGSTFTGIASLVLMNKLEQIMDDEWRDELIYWCVHRQVGSGGMQGRPNKAEDTCYSSWTGGTLKLIQADQFLNHGAQCQNRRTTITILNKTILILLLKDLGAHKVLVVF
mmetsp:Transcript_10780/g.14282  ORF Transcript_10780/g.14282 Transcript_10780/m.14282 type:complete len:260 (-) Transcript_10780:469-1248(-)